MLKDPKMSNSAPKKLSLVREIITEGKIEDALQLIKDIELINNLTPEETLRSLYYKADLYLALGDYASALKFVEQLYQQSQEMKMPFFVLGALSIKEWVLVRLDKFEDFYKCLEQHEKLFNALPREDSPEYQEKEVSLLMMRGGENFWKGNLDLALEKHKKSLILFEKIEWQSVFNSHLYCLSPLGWLAYDYMTKGDLQLALDYAEKYLSLIPKGEYYLIWKGNDITLIGSIYAEKGILTKALEYYTRALDIFNKVRVYFGWEQAVSYYRIIKTLLAQKNVNQAQNYLEEFKDFNEKSENHITSAYYQLACAMILKSSDRIEAEYILKKIIEENSIIYSTNLAVGYLCDLYLEDFRESHQMEILDDIQPLLDQLQRFARQTNSYNYLVNSKLLQAKLALLQINMLEARKLLTEAQQIADEHGLQLLAGEISREHDRLLEELTLWESIKKTQASVSERLKLASLDDAMDLLQKRRPLKPLEVVNEEPVLLAVMSKTGYMLFSNPFTTDISFDETRIGEFVSFFNSFIDQIFSETIDRVKFGEFTILHKVIDSISLCYLFQGQSYTALKRLNNFYNTIKNDPSIMDIFNLAKKTGESINIEEIPNLEALIVENFLTDPREIGVSIESDDTLKLIKKSRQIKKKRTSRLEIPYKLVILEVVLLVVVLLLFTASHFLTVLWTTLGETQLGEFFGMPLTMKDMTDVALYIALGIQIFVIVLIIVSFIKQYSSTQMRK